MQIGSIEPTWQDQFWGAKVFVAVCIAIVIVKDDFFLKFRPCWQNQAQIVCRIVDERHRGKQTSTYGAGWQTDGTTDD